MTIEASTLWWAIGIILAVFGTLTGVLGRIMWKWAGTKDSRQKIIEDSQRLEAEKRAFQSERVTKLEVNTMAQAASMAEGRGRFQKLDDKTDCLAREKLDKLEFEKYCTANEREHARIEAGIDKLANRFDTLSTKFDEVNDSMTATVDRFQGSVETLKRIEGKLADVMLLGNKMEMK